MSDDEIIEVMAKGAAPYLFDGTSELDEEMLAISRQEVTEEARQSLHALRSAGYAVVPVEPTEAMKGAGGDCIEYPGEFEVTTSTARDIYRAMISAAEGEKGE